MKSVMQTESFLVSSGIKCFTRQGYYAVSLRSQHCYCVPLADQLKRNDLKALAYVLEDELPIDAESMSVLVAGSKTRPIAIACDGQRIAKALGQEERLQGLRCLAVLPEIEFLLAELGPSQRKIGRLIVWHGATFDDLAFEHGQVSNWMWKGVSPAEGTAVSTEQSRETAKQVTEAGNGVAVWLAGDEPSAELSEFQVLDWRDADWGTAQASQLLRGRTQPSMNFNNGPLDWVDPLAPARRSVGLAYYSICLLVMACAAGLWLRASRYQQQAARTVQQQEAVFSALFPNQPIPIGVMSRLESERRRLSATRDSQSIPTLGNALPAMHAFWSGLPENARFNITHLHFTHRQLESIELIAKSYDDLETLQKSLSATGFEIPITGANQSARGVIPRWDKMSWKPTTTALPTEASEASDE